MFVLLLVCLGLILLSVAVGVGSVTLSPLTVWRVLWEPETASRLEMVATHARLSRVLMALGVGVALGAAGALTQALYRNPLASPDITGVTQGAVTAAVLWMVFGPPVAAGQVSWILPGISALGAFLAAAITWSVSRLSGRVDPIRLILMGVLVGGVLSAFTSIALLFAGDDTQRIVGWLSGSLSSVTWQKLQLFGGAVIVVLPLLLIAIPMANVLQLGEEPATGLGQAITPAMGIVLVAACGLTAAAVCTVGGVGFVGLAAPHLLRRVVGSDLRRLVPAAALTGGALVMLADVIARNLRPVDVGRWLNIPINVNALSLPVGIYLALLGGPFFLFILRKAQR